MTRKTEPFIVGIDPSLAATGLTLGRKSSMTVKSKHAEGDDRLRLLYARVKSECFGADFAVLEDLPKNAMSAGLTGMAQGSVRMALLDLDIPFIRITPSTLKKAATGSGKATKVDMRKAAETFYEAGEIDLNIKDNDQVDAFWLREVGLTLLGKHSLLKDPVAVNRYVDTPPVREVMTRLE